MPCWTFNGPTRWVYPVSPDLNFSNRPVRTRLPGGVAGEERKLSPLCRLRLLLLFRGRVRAGASAFQGGRCGRERSAEVAAENALAIEARRKPPPQNLRLLVEFSARRYRPMESPCEMSCSCTDCGFIFSPMSCCGVTLFSASIFGAWALWCETSCPSATGSFSRSLVNICAS
jgi:hypothetical protein